MSVVQGGSSFYLSPSVYKYICGESMEEILEGVSVNEVSDVSVKHFFTQVIKFMME